MVHHWSGVDVGEYFDLTFEYNEARYSQARVLVPFQRCPTTGFPKCMLEGIDFQVKNVPSDSEWHVRRSLHMKVEPPLKGAKRQKALKDSTMRSSFTAAPTKEDSDQDVEALPETPAPKPHHIPLESTPSDSVGDLGGTRDVACGVFLPTAPGSNSLPPSCLLDNARLMVCARQSPKSKCDRQCQLRCPATGWYAGRFQALSRT